MAAGLDVAQEKIDGIRAHLCEARALRRDAGALCRPAVTRLSWCHPPPFPPMLSQAGHVLLPRPGIVKAPSSEHLWLDRLRQPSSGTGNLCHCRWASVPILCLIHSGCTRHYENNRADNAGALLQARRRRWTTCAARTGRTRWRGCGGSWTRPCAGTAAGRPSAAAGCCARGRRICAAEARAGL